MIQSPAATLLQRQALRQFVKFCIVGASSFTINFALLYLLHRQFHLHVIAANTIAFMVAVTNGYVWNRRWTFKAVGLRRQREQYAMFVGVNVVGLGLNTAIVAGVLRLLTGSWSPRHTPGSQLLAATVVATAVVVFWNFYANRHWTFRRERA